MCIYDSNDKTVLIMEGKEFNNPIRNENGDVSQAKLLGTSVGPQVVAVTVPTIDLL